jgi:hypothetical protein
MRTHAVVGVAAVTAAVVGMKVVNAGSLTPPPGPINGTMVTLEEIRADIQRLRADFFVVPDRRESATLLNTTGWTQMAEGNGVLNSVTATGGNVARIRDGTGKVIFVFDPRAEGNSNNPASAAIHAPMNIRYTDGLQAEGFAPTALTLIFTPDPAD